MVIYNKHFTKVAIFKSPADPLRLGQIFPVESFVYKQVELRKIN